MLKYSKELLKFTIQLVERKTEISSVMAEETSSSASNLP